MRVRGAVAPASGLVSSLLVLQALWSSHRALTESHRVEEPEVLQKFEELQGPRGNAAVDVRLKSGKGEKLNLHSQRLFPIGQMMSILCTVTYRQADILTFNASCKIHPRHACMQTTS